MVTVAAMAVATALAVAVIVAVIEAAIVTVLHMLAVAVKVVTAMIDNLCAYSYSCQHAKSRTIAPNSMRLQIM
jgi:hypothetical protein